MKRKNRKDIDAEYEHLLVCFWGQKITEEELLRLQEILVTCPEKMNEFKELIPVSVLLDEHRLARHYNADRAWHVLSARLRNRRMWFVRCACAIVLLLMIGGVYRYFQMDDVAGEESSVLFALQEEAIGKVYLELDENQWQELSMDSSVFKEIQLLNEDVPVQKRDSLEGEEHWLRLFTTKGAMYALALSDGTKVWLNAQSELIYPDVFHGEKRHVYLKGEAYFEVAKDEAHPFFVWMDGIAVKVLGTSFNVKAYPDEQEQRVSLVTGKVNIVRKKDSVMLAALSPSLEWRMDMTNEQSVIQKFDEREVLAWKNHLFVFKDLPLNAVLTQIERWYDVEFSVPGELADYRYSGTIPREVTIAHILDILRLTGEIEFVMKPDKKIEVIPK